MVTTTSGEYEMLDLRSTRLVDGVFVNDRYDRRSQFLGRCSLKPEDDIAWINVPKNASNTIGRFIRHWRHTNWFDEKNLVDERRFFMVLRDPVERWKRSVLEVIRIYMEHHRLGGDTEWEVVRNGVFIDGLKDFNYDDTAGSYRGIFNLHVFRQVDHLIDLRLDSVRFLLMDEPGFNEELSSVLDVDNLGRMNATVDSKIKMHFLPMLEKELYCDELDSRLKKIYASDYSLIDYAKGLVKEPIVSWADSL